jgi:flagellar hook assembly protein FlgD
MRAVKLLAVFAIAALAIGTFSAVALAGKKKKTSVVFFTGSPKVNKSGKVTAKGSLNTATPCEPARSVRLQVLDVNGAVLFTLDGKSSDSVGNWSLSGQLPKGIPANTTSVRVKAKKRTAGKFVCKAGVSAAVPVTVAT